MPTLPRATLRTRVTTAIATLRQRGEVPSVRKVHALIGYGSLRDVSRLVKEMVTAAPAGGATMVTAPRVLEENDSMPTTVIASQPQAETPRVTPVRQPPQQPCKRVIFIGAMHARPTADRFVIDVPCAGSFLQVLCEAPALDLRHLAGRALWAAGHFYTPPIDIGDPREVVVRLDAASVVPDTAFTERALTANWGVVRCRLVTAEIDYGEFLHGVETPFGATPITLDNYVQLPLLLVGGAMRLVQFATRGDQFVVAGPLARWKGSLSPQLRQWARAW